MKTKVTVTLAGPDQSRPDERWTDTAASSLIGQTTPLNLFGSPIGTATCVAAEREDDGTVTATFEIEIEGRA